jgi:hypothetical protein
LGLLSYARPASAYYPANQCQHQQDDSHPQQEAEGLIESAYQEQDDRYNTGDY